jgi:probable phosphoglycerate mutase
MTTIYLIRHGENDFVKNKKLAGWLPDIHLNAQGQAQAKALAEILSQIKFKAIYASPLERTMETAEPIALAQDLSVHPLKSLGEVDVGRWQGQTLKSLKKRKLWPVVQHTPSMARFPEGESYPQAQARVIAQLDQLREKHTGKKTKIACITHADVIKIAVAHYIGLPLDLFQRLTIDPASISILHFDNTVRLLTLNDISAKRACTDK